MSKMLRLALAAAMLAAVFAPSANAGPSNTKDIVDFGSPGGSAITVAGCQPKGLWAIPFGPTGGLLADGTYFYAVTAVTASGEKVACGPFQVTLPAAGPEDAAVLGWNNTPGATSYNVYRSASPTLASPALLGTVSAAACTTPASNPRCPFVDAGTASPTPGSPTFPAATSAANGHPDFKIVEALTYDALPEDIPADDANPPALKTDLIHFPPGLLSNPLATRDGAGNLVRCKLSATGPSLIGSTTVFGSDDPNEDTCPRASLVGTVQVFALTRRGAPPGTVAPTLIQGDIYNGEPLGTEAGRLFVVLRPPCSAGHHAPLDPGGPACSSPALLGSPLAQVEKSFLGAKANVVLRGDGSYGIDVDTTDVKSGADAPLSPSSRILAGPPGSLAEVLKVPIQVQRLTQDLFGSADQGTEAGGDDLPFMTLPTSCGEKTLSADVTMWHAAGPFSGSGVFTPTDCGAVPFAPKIAGTIDASGGQTGEGGHPSIDVTITQALGESATESAAVQLPPLFGVSLTALGNTCTEANVQAQTCPAGATVGSAIATSPLSEQPLAGPVLLVEVPNALPKLSVFLTGVTNLRLDGSVSLVNGAIVNTFDNIPELPLTSFRIILNGGAGGLLQNSQSLCSGTGNLQGTFTGYNGATVPVTAPLTGVGIDPCPAAAKARKPKAKFTLRGVASGNPVLSMLVRRGSKADASLITRVKLLLGKGLTADVKEARRGDLRVNASRRLANRVLTIRKKSLTVKRVPGGDSPRVRAKFRKGGLNASKALQNKGKGARVRLRLRVKTKGGRTFRLKVRVKAKS